MWSAKCRVGGAKDTDVDVADGDPGGGKPTAKLLVKGRGEGGSS